MPYAISAWFDSDTESRVRSIWEDLHKHQVDSTLGQGSYRPHITLAVVADARGC